MIKSLNPPSAREWIFSLKAFIAAMLALYIALLAGLERPYWAMAAVYVVANPLSGATTSKALYRALGTFIGAAGSILLLPIFASTPELFVIVVGLWTGLFLFISLLDRTPRGYVFMLAGYSLPLIALPSVSAPETIFDVAVARAEEITLGIVCAAVVGSLFLPVRVGTVFSALLKAWLTDAQGWAVACLTSGEENRAASRNIVLKRQKLATDIRALDLLASQLAYDSAHHSTLVAADELRGRMALMLPILSSLEDRLNAVAEAGAGSSALAAVTEEILAWMQDTGQKTNTDAESLQAAISALEPHAGYATSWHGLVLSSALERMKELVDLWDDCRELHRRIEAGDKAGKWRPAFRTRRTLGKVRYYDFGMLIFSAASVAVATILSGLVWIASGWNEGAGCVIMTAVGCSFFAALDNPAAQIRSFTLWMTVSVAASAFYLFALLPLVHDFVGLVAIFAIPFILVGTMVSRPQFTLIAMLLAVNTASFVGLQANYSADFTSFINGNIASILGGVFGLAWTLLTRPFGTAFLARRLVRRGWYDLAQTASGGRNQNPDRFAGRVFDRLGQLVPRLAAGVPDDIAAADLLLEIRIGINVLDLQRIRKKLPFAHEAHVRQMLDGVAFHYGELAATGRMASPSAGLLTLIDATLAELATMGESQHRRSVLQACVGLRRALFPVAPPPEKLASGNPIAPPALLEIAS